MVNRNMVRICFISDLPKLALQDDVSGRKEEAENRFIYCPKPVKYQLKIAVLNP
jgi:hypothetical protein